MALAIMCGKMAESTRATTDSIRSTAKAHIHTQTVASTEVSGSMACSTVLDLSLMLIAHASAKASGPTASSNSGSSHPRTSNTTQKARHLTTKHEIQKKPFCSSAQKDKILLVR